MWHPCCGSSLKQGSKFLALLSMALSLMGAILSCIFFLQPSNLSGESQSSKVEYGIFISIDAYCNDSIIPEPLMLFVLLIFCILNLFFAIMLFIGAEQENLRVCVFWWRISFVLCIVDSVLLIVSVAMCTTYITDIVINSAGVLRSVYELWVVKAFINELKIKQEGEGTCRVTVNMA